MIYIESDWGSWEKEGMGCVFLNKFYSNIGFLKLFVYIVLIKIKLIKSLNILL